MEIGGFYYIAIKGTDGVFQIVMKEDEGQKPNNMTKKEAEKFVVDAIREGTAEEDILFLHHPSVEVKITVSCANPE